MDINTKRGTAMLNIIQGHFKNEKIELSGKKDSPRHCLLMRINRASIIKFQYESFKWTKFKSIIQHVLDDDFECNICMGDKNKYLFGCSSCYNVICSNCKLDIAKHNGNNGDKCPYCRSKTINDDDDSDESGYFVINIKTVK